MPAKVCPGKCCTGGCAYHIRSMRMPAERKMTQVRRAESLLTQDWRGSNEKRKGAKLESVELIV